MYPLKQDLLQSICVLVVRNTATISVRRMALALSAKAFSNSLSYNYRSFKLLSFWASLKTELFTVNVNTLLSLCHWVTSTRQWHGAVEIFLIDFYLKYKTSFIKLIVNFARLSIEKLIVFRIYVTQRTALSSLKLVLVSYSLNCVIFWLNVSIGRSFRKARIRGVQDTVEWYAHLESTSL